MRKKKAKCYLLLGTVIMLVFACICAFAFVKANLNQAAEKKEFESMYTETEIDFIIQREGQLIPIEVKSADNTRAKSLKIYMETYKPAYAIKLSAKNFGFEDGKKTVQLYAAFFI